MTRVAVFGSSGFVGSAVVEMLTRRGAEVRPVDGIRVPPMSALASRDVVANAPELLALVLDALAGCDAVVNAAGDPDASKRDENALFGSNAAFPLLIATAADRLGIKRFVHISSAVVQGRRPILDDSMAYDLSTTYGRSKALGEVLIANFANAVIYRPPSVHAASRRVTQLVGRIGRSPFSSVAAPGDQPAPHALITNVADAVSYLALCEAAPPKVVIHPWEGMTARNLLVELGGGREPLVITRPLATVTVRLARLAGQLVPPLAANARRLELIWFGQGQAASWLTLAGWGPMCGTPAWKALSAELQVDGREDQEQL